MKNDAVNITQPGFTGHIKDSETGLNYMQARYYDPVIGRFLSVDPVGFLGSGEDTRYFNRYAYTGNNPINAIDPDGNRIVSIATTPQDKLDVAKAISYLSRSSTFSTSYNAVDKNDTAILIEVSRTAKDHSYDPRIYTIVFNPELGGQDLKNGSTTSPASALGHEIRHAERHLDLGDDRTLMILRDVKMKTKEEHDISTGFQNQMNRELNAEGAQEGLRTSHFRKPVQATDVTNGNQQNMIPFAPPPPLSRPKD